jgi:L-ascorbate metabolism protein UlaG (beta-lactamase superfamily)
MGGVPEQTVPFKVVMAPPRAKRFRADGAGRFVNPDGTRSHGFGEVFKWAVVDKLLGKRRKSPATADVPHVEPDIALLAVAPDRGARLTWLGHASWLVQIAGVSLLIDPVLRDSIFGMTRRNGRAPLPPAALPPITAQLVTHNHYDHMDMPSLRAVGAPVLTGMRSASLYDQRLPVTELGWWDTVDVGLARVTFVPSHHWSRRSLRDVNKSLWGGFVIEGGGVSVYHAGDTAYFEGFRDIGRRFPRIDAALLPIGAYDPEWFMSSQHMNPAEAVRAFEDLGARRMIAMHWGTFKLTDEPLDEPPVLLRQHAEARSLPPTSIHVAAIGETIAVGHIRPRPPE